MIGLSKGAVDSDEEEGGDKKPADKDTAVKEKAKEAAEPEEQVEQPAVDDGANTDIEMGDEGNDETEAADKLINDAAVDAGPSDAKSTPVLITKKNARKAQDTQSAAPLSNSATTLGEALNIDPELLTQEQLNEMHNFLNGIAPQAQAIAKAAEAQRIAAAAAQAAAAATASQALGQSSMSSSVPRQSMSSSAATWKAPPRKIPDGMTSATTMAEIQMGDIDQHEILTKRWLNPAQLQQLVDQKGLKYKKGKFSASEDQQLEEALHRYQIEHNLDKDELIDIIFAKGKKARETYSNFWSQVTSALVERPIIAVYHHVRRLYHPMNHQGTWSPEEDAKLKELVAEHGQAWEAISQKIGRMSSDCRDRWRNHVKDSETRKVGPWDIEEEEELVRIVTDMTTEQGKSADSEVFWSVVSERMRGTRTRQQCRIKWTDGLNKRVKNAGLKPRWGDKDSYILVQKLRSLPVSHDSEIDWKQLPDPTWNLWSAHQLQRRWTRLKSRVDPEKTRSFAEVLNLLAREQDDYPKDWLENPTVPVRSNEFVNDDDDDEADDDKDDKVDRPVTGNGSGAQPQISAKDLNELMTAIGGVGGAN